MLETNRLFLRLFQERDLAPYAEINADPAVVEFLGNGRRCRKRETGCSAPAGQCRHNSQRAESVWSEKCGRTLVLCTDPIDDFSVTQLDSKNE